MTAWFTYLFFITVYICLLLRYEVRRDNLLLKDIDLVFYYDITIQNSGKTILD